MGPPNRTLVYFEKWIDPVAEAMIAEVPGVEVVRPAFKCQVYETPLEPVILRTDGFRFQPDKVSDCNSSGNQLRVLVIHNSMILAMRDYLANSFAHVRFVWLVPSSFDDIKKYIAQEHPDIVIEEMVERRLSEVPVPAPVVAAEISPSSPPTDRGGWIELTQDSPGTVIVDGWARWQSSGDRRTIFVNTNLPITGMTLSEYPRPDVSAAEHDNRLIRSGFQLRLNVDPSKPRPEAVRLCVWTEDPVFGPHRLRYVNRGEWDTCPAS